MFQRYCLNRCGAANAGVVEEKIEPAMTRRRVFNHMLDLLLVRHFHRHGMNPPGIGAELLDRRSQCLRIPVRHQDHRARLQQCFTQSETDARGGAGNHAPFATEILFSSHIPSSSCTGCLEELTVIYPAQPALCETIQLIYSLRAAAQEIWTEVCRVGVGVKAPARFDAQPALIDI